MAATKRSAAQEDDFQKALKDLEKDLRPHQQQVNLFDRRYRAYRGVIESGLWLRGGRTSSIRRWRCSRSRR